MTYPYPALVKLGPANVGLANVGYRVVSVDQATVYQALTTVGVYETVVPGDYAAEIDLPSGVNVLVQYYKGATAVVQEEVVPPVLGENGRILWTYTEFDVGGIVPLPGTTVWLSTASPGSFFSQKKVTDELGQVQFRLNAGTIYVWRSHPSRTFADPDPEVISSP